MEATARIYGRNAFKMSAGARWAPLATMIKKLYGSIGDLQAEYI